MSSLPDAVTTGELEGLRALRDRLASEIESCDSARDVAALSARLMEVMKRVAEIEAKAPAQASVADEIAERRRRRKPLKNGEAREA